MNFDSNDIINFGALWLILGSLVAGFTFALFKQGILRFVAVCFAGFCFCMYAFPGWIFIWNLILPLFGEGAIGQLLALVLTPGVFAGMSVAAYILICRLNPDDTSIKGEEK